MTALAAAGLLALALIDGAFAGFRSSAGRTGLIGHRDSDHLAARRGAALACLLITPVIALASGDVLLQHARIATYARVGEAMLAVYGPYALVVLAALTCYMVLGWRQRYIATAVILGPLTLLRPVVAVLGAAVGALVSHDAIAAACAGLSAVAVLTVEPLADRRWYAPHRRVLG